MPTTIRIEEEEKIVPLFLSPTTRSLRISSTLCNRETPVTSVSSVTTYESRLRKGTNHAYSRARIRNDTPAIDLTIRRSLVSDASGLKTFVYVSALISIRGRTIFSILKREKHEKLPCKIGRGLFVERFNFALWMKRDRAKRLKQVYAHEVQVYVFVE